MGDSVARSWPFVWGPVEFTRVAQLEQVWTACVGVTGVALHPSCPLSRRRATAQLLRSLHACHARVLTDLCATRIALAAWMERSLRFPQQVSVLSDRLLAFCRSAPILVDQRLAAWNSDIALVERMLLDDLVPQQQQQQQQQQQRASGSAPHENVEDAVRALTLVNDSVSELLRELAAQMGDLVTLCMGVFVQHNVQPARSWFGNAPFDTDANTTTPTTTPARAAWRVGMVSPSLLMPQTPSAPLSLEHSAHASSPLYVAALKMQAHAAAAAALAAAPEPGAPGTGSSRAMASARRQTTASTMRSTLDRLDTLHDSLAKQRALVDTTAATVHEMLRLAWPELAGGPSRVAGPPSPSAGSVRDFGQLDHTIELLRQSLDADPELGTYSLMDSAA